MTDDGDTSMMAEFLNQVMLEENLVPSTILSVLSLRLG